MQTSAAEARRLRLRTTAGEALELIEDELGADELGGEGEGEEEETAGRVALEAAQTSLVMPFAFHTADNADPGRLAKEIQTRTVTADQEMLMWQKTPLQGAEEFSPHFRRLLVGNVYRCGAWPVGLVGCSHVFFCFVF